MLYFRDRAANSEFLLSSVPTFLQPSVTQFPHEHTFFFHDLTVFHATISLGDL